MTIGDHDQHSQSCVTLQNAYNRNCNCDKLKNSLQIK